MFQESLFLVETVNVEECLVFDSVVTYTSLTRIKDAPKRGSWDENADNDDDDDDDDIDEDLSESQKGEKHTQFDCHISQLNYKYAL